MARSILHIDQNCFYASVEMQRHPELRNQPLAVCGSQEARHGIVLTANYLAKPRGVKTGMAIWQARQKCPELVVLPPDMAEYIRFSKMAREIYADYTDQIEPFGLDEAWLDVTGSAAIAGEAMHIAQEISNRIKFELGITASIGVADNKITAKLGSDCKKPDAITRIEKDNYKEIVYPLPVDDLLYVGPVTKEKLCRGGITTIGALAEAPVEFLLHRLGKMGVVLHTFANGQDISRVQNTEHIPTIKSVGNSATTPRDLINNEDVRPPFGARDCNMLASIDAPVILWTLDPAAGKQVPGEKMARFVLSQAKDGDIILLHGTTQYNLDAVKPIIDGLKEKGFSFVTVDELFQRKGVTPENGIAYKRITDSGQEMYEEPPAGRNSV